MQSNFGNCLKVTLTYEGGWSNHPKDPGGATMKGVIQRVFTAYLRAEGKAIRSVRSITEAELQDIYRRYYWNKVHGDELPAGVDLCIFDAGVNSGPSRAVKWLQRGINKVSARKIKVDGLLGPITIGAAAAYAGPSLIDAICDARLGFLRSLRIFVFFWRGWIRRVEGVRDVAKHMALAARAKPANDNQVIMAKAA